jgi:prepilin-type N-terminal cleavage/methylation domain-containing protein
MKSRLSPRPAFSRGFTLTELAMVLLIVALLIGSMMLPLAAQDDIRRTQDTRHLLAEVREALLGFAAANGRLPRPAISATDGAENPNPCADDAACFGFIPWATLGVPKLDAWDKIIRYSVTPAYANAAFTLATIPNRKVLTRGTGGALAYLAGQAGVCTARQCTPAIIFSQGRRNWGRNDAGIPYGNNSATNLDESTNDAGPTDFIARPGTDNTGAPGGEFDDQVVWLSPNILFNRMVAAGRLP